MSGGRPRSSAGRRQYRQSPPVIHLLMAVWRSQPVIRRSTAVSCSRRRSSAGQCTAVAAGNPPFDGKIRRSPAVIGRLMALSGGQWRASAARRHGISVLRSPPVIHDSTAKSGGCRQSSAVGRQWTAVAAGHPAFDGKIRQSPPVIRRSMAESGSRHRSSGNIIPVITVILWVILSVTVITFGYR